ncbi:MAG: 3-oxoacyl-[acyl-carrier-protein] reductase [Dehalococcoidia bacterium]|nr:3-oxoacyl-[acyl-carrier-protein] reductase [Dehalococcoidia bacterium]
MSPLGPWWWVCPRSRSSAGNGDSRVGTDASNRLWISQQEPPLELTGKVALVTGGSRGIGKAAALALGRQGAWVAVNYLSNAEAAEEVASAIREVGGQALVVQADAGEASQVEALFKRVQDAWGHLDILVNNAGQTRDGLVMRMSEDDWDFVIQTNLKSAFLCTRAAMRPMIRQRWGRIINMSSIIGVRGNGGQANYAAAKAGLIGLTKSVAKEVAARNITCNALAPGWIETDMVASVPEALRNQALAQIPAGRMGTAEDVAGTVAFLASDAASYITGQVIGIDGGMRL